MRQRLISVSQLGKIVASRRHALRLSQQAVAAKLGVSQSALSEIEAGRRKLSAQRILDIANILDLELVIQDKQRSRQTEW